MRELDIKLLWGRSGNRCAICKMELSPNGDKYTLGEMAHIVAKSNDGPRGNENLALDQRDNYSNLILLCPTHHSEIDKNPNIWSRAELSVRKSEHEQWVSSQLDQGRISVLPVDNAAFLSERESVWRQVATERVWAIGSITPLSISGDVIDPLSTCFREFYDGLYVLCFPNGLERVNRRHTRPSVHGLLNEDLRNLVDGNGHKLEVFRNGHCEYLVCLQGSVDQITEAMRERRGARLEADKVIRYTDLADTIRNQWDTLSALWQKCLPFQDMTFTWMLVNTSRSIMYSHESESIGPVFGFSVSEAQLCYREVIGRDDHGALIEQTARRAVNSFGLVLDELFESNDTWQRPTRMT
jgi:hypothetical protein